MTKQLYHKIPKVEKSVCTVEQMMAYNIASTLESDYGRKFREFAAKSTKANINETVHEMIRLGMKLYAPKNGKVQGVACNNDMVQCALNAGLENYLLKVKYHIFTEYEQIGKAFPAEYLKQ